MTQPAPILLPELLQTYLDIGIPLIPIKPGSKIPLTEHGAKDASADPIQIGRWLFEYPDCNWAMVAGHQMKDGRYLALLDVDSYKEVDTADLDIPEGPRELTPRGGYHHLFGSREPVGSCPAVLGRVGLELRGVNEYNVCAPSSNQHGRYIWELEAEVGDVRIPDLPEWLYAPKPIDRPADIEEDDPINSVLGQAFEFMGWLGSSHPGKRYVRCPWADTHSVPSGLGQDSSTVILPVTRGSKFGAFKCKHAHCLQKTALEAFQACSPEAQAHAKGKFPILRKVDFTEDEDTPPPRKSVASETYVPHKTLVGAFGKGGDFKCEKVVANVILLCSQGPWEGVIAYDEMAESTMLMKRAPHEQTASPEYPRPWNDNDDTNCAFWLQTCAYSCKVPSSLVKEGTDSIAKEKKYNRLTDYLRGLKWDGVPRLDTWLRDYLGAGDNSYVSACGRMWMISCVARAMQPGCQVDYVLVLEGKQRSGKSSAFRILGGEWFTDDIGDISTKDSPERMRGNWIVEIPEMAGILVRESSQVKGFITRPVDNYREAYGRRAGKFKRRCCLCGTVNEEQYLKDHTGGGRYWCCRTNVTVDGLRRLVEDRDQLWAEAMKLYVAREPWWPTTPEFWAAQAKESEARRSRDPWEDVLRSALGDAKETSETEAFEALVIPSAQRDEKQQSRIGRVLQVLGFRSENGKWLR